MQYFESNRPMQTFLPAVQQLLTSPRAFFAGAPTTAFYSNSLFFISIIIFLASFIGVPFRDMTLLFLLPVSWGLTLISIRLWAAYLSWAAKRFANTKITPSNAFMISGYASTPLLFSFVPLIGAVAGLWNLYLLWVALTARYQMKSGVAIVIIAIPTMIAITLAATVVIMAMKVFSVA